MGRLTNNDRKFGPVTYGKVDWNPLRIILSSEGGEGDDEEHQFAKTSLTIYIFSWAFRIYLGRLIKPAVYKVKANGWDEATIKRLGRDWYPYSFSRDYGFSLHNGFLQIFYGLQNDHNHYTHIYDGEYLTYKLSDQNKTFTPIQHKGWSTHLPWTQNRVISYRLFDDKGNVFYEIENKKGLKGRDYFDHSYQAKQECPKVLFALKDYDGTDITAKTVIEETIYARGKGRFKWLSWFYKPEVYRRLDIEFDKETGPEKGSWKGGTTGCSFVINNNENHVQAMQGYCQDVHRSKSGLYKIKFVSREVPA